MSVLLAYDGSAHSRRAIDVAGGFLSGPAVVLYVLSVEPPVVPAAGAGVPVATPDISVLEREAVERAERVLEEGCQRAAAAGFGPEPVLERGGGGRLAWEAIVRVADERDVQVIVVGRRGISTIKALVVGSVADGVVQHTTRPVVVVPEGS
ncbi:MAG: universal stress protein [Actinobacteria bacterium]|nr:universal stress protein [Actinomycetota bacterium]